MWYRYKYPNFYIMLLSDVALFIVAFVGAYLLRFEFKLSPADRRQILAILPYLVPCKLACFYFFGHYRGMWRYTSLVDVWRLAQACLLSSLLLVAAVLYLHTFTGFSRSVFLLDGGLAFLLTGGLRLGIRSYCQAVKTPRGIEIFAIPRLQKWDRNHKRVLIIGAGDAAEKILRESFDNPELSYRVVGLLDDDPAKCWRSVHGIQVLGSIDQLPYIVEKQNVQEVFIAVPSATGAQMRRFVEACKSCNVSYKTLPTIGHIMDGRVGISDLREVDFEDLLGRPPVQLDTSSIRAYLQGATVLVTGCGGSIGSELCRQIVRFSPARLVLVDAGEANLFHIHMELHYEFGYRNSTCILAGVQDRALMDHVFQKYRPQVVFHAAAYKHVPMIESNPWVAVFNNVLGSSVVMEMALQYGTQHFVLISTDKAVRPTNVMGASKRLAEIMLQSLEGNGTRFMAVRFGNVVGSSGSVIPLFRRQIEHGGPVTVTHPEVTRYFMTILEAAQLVLQAGALGEDGEIFVLEMGTPVKIADMARDLIRLSGKEPDKDIEIVYTGLRPGEKLYEELITADEGVVTTRHERIMILRTNGDGNGGGDREGFRQWLRRGLEELYSSAEAHDASGIKRKLKELVPEYTPQETECVL